jgi:hypothetical protein
MPPVLVHRVGGSPQRRAARTRQTSPGPRQHRPLRPSWSQLATSTATTRKSLLKRGQTWAEIATSQPITPRINAPFSPPKLLVSEYACCYLARVTFRAHEQQAADCQLGAQHDAPAGQHPAKVGSAPLPLLRATCLVSQLPVAPERLGATRFAGSVEGPWPGLVGATRVGAGAHAAAC